MSYLVKEKPELDVLLLLEGTYPYIRGGVSSWVHQIISSMPELTFGAIFIGGQEEDYPNSQYELPSNFVYLKEFYLAENWRTIDPVSLKGKPKQFAVMEGLHDIIKKKDTQQIGFVLDEMDKIIEKRGGISRKDFLYSEASWRQINKLYYKYCPELSFIDYFWTVRMMHSPLFTLAKLAREAPKARLYHSISTGYAGYLGALTNKVTGAPLLLSEHGIYTKERRIDLIQANWIKDNNDILANTMEQSVNYTRELWIKFFEGLGRMAYQASQQIVSLYEGNQQRQIEDGAPAEKCTVIPNGVNVQRLSQVKVDRSRKIPPVLGLVGRVVAIKDIKTFIRAMQKVVDGIPNAEGWIIGPTEEDPEYAHECLELIESLGLKEHVKFLGFQNIDKIMPQLGLVVLSSISEAQPLVVLEGFAVGIPAVTTNVGCCGELIYGIDAEDKSLGAAGAVVPIASPDALASAALALLTDEERWRSAHDAALARVDKYYTDTLMVQRYRHLYTTTFAKES